MSVPSDTTTRLFDEAGINVVFTFTPKETKINKKVEPEWRLRHRGTNYLYKKPYWRKNVTVVYTLTGKLNPYWRNQLERLVDDGAIYQLQCPFNLDAVKEKVVITLFDCTFDQGLWATSETSESSVSYTLKMEVVQT